MNVRKYTFFTNKNFITFLTGTIKGPLYPFIRQNTLKNAQIHTFQSIPKLTNDPSTMKNSILSFTALLCFGLLLFSSCKKDPTYDQQLSGHWISSKVTYGDEDGTNLYKFELILEASKEFDLTQTTLISKTVQTGIWAANEGTKEVTLTFDDGTAKAKYDITSLSGTQMTAQTVLGGKRFIIVFKK